jgi:TRAP-type mannitol/chloroaromatic compound transport system substrate-binding protein
MKKIMLIALAFVLSACGGQQSGSDEQQTAAKAQTFKWKLVTTWPKNFPGLGMGPERFAKLVDRMSDGRLKVKVYGAGDLVPAMQAFDAVQQGTAEMGHGGAYYWKGKISISPFFAAVPFGMTAQEMNSWLYYGGGLELWREAYAPFGIIPLAGGNTGVQMAGWFNKEINSIDDLKGLRMRIPGLGGEVFNRVGGVSVNLPGAELFTSLQNGVIDATEWVGPYNDLAFGLHKAAKFYYYPGWHEPGPTLEFTVNKEAWESLPADLQAIVETAARAVNQDMLDEFTALNNNALQTLLNEHGVQLRKLPDDVIDALRMANNELMQEVAAESEFSKRVYDSYTTFQKNVKAWHELSEKAYINARD